MVTQSVTIAVPLLLVIVILYAIKHRKTKLGGLVLGFLLGISLTPTGVSGLIADKVVSLVVYLVDAVSGVFV
ncbi:hypothetical protein ABZ816_32455 [Actinosynnema sp. NPDC047251]|uniref:Putative membrane protein n=1 Tax=Saccharothrix espanaensis (strain ATCC 51144 / DSM 44229 / JCM 9112 / NBRC 15066 / NRRL 15764) TaxID=1179773 RepID=K0JV92_SACES|nr:hypothetical protein [Saccharothrix espanaensis]CCH29906.1 putative membrane protein [Saccharothrix espanaensis DSM 44229]